MSKELIRLSKLMSEQGICSRREADRYIEAGQVIVNGKVIQELGTRVQPNAHIELKAKAQNKQNSKVTILLNKPLGFVSTQPEKGYREALELITPENQFRQKGAPALEPNHMHKLAVTGRLDIDSKGLLIFTQDGSLVKKLIGPDSSMEKEYLIGFEGQLNDKALKNLRGGLFLGGKPLKPAKVELIEENLLKIILTEGKKRQIRRMCEMVNLRVLKLKRVRVGNVRLGDLPEGKWRFLESHERF